MKFLSGNEIRERYLRFFEARNHARYPSDSLVPANDPTLLFTGAGMNQFKDMFLGKGTLPHKRITTAQKCLRVPDLENVGYTPRHHTFFEMLGNFSFGDYFKKDCIRWEWDFFSKELGIPEQQMVVTVYLDDDEAFSIWHKEVGLPENRIFRFGEKENFWPAEAPSKGPNGPCGPCSEIYFDNEPGQPMPDPRGLKSLPDPRFLEIGNCVFTQFDRQPDGTLLPLPQKNIDVGLGLERIAAVLQRVPNNFETDLFLPYLQFLGERSGRQYGKDKATDVRMRRMADHIRAVTFCIADGALPGNEGRGYVVRKILRRAARDGYELGLDKPVLCEMVALVGQIMGSAYPDVVGSAAQVRSIVQSEEEGFRSVYLAGIARVDAFFPRPATLPRGGGELPLVKGSGEFAFELHDTYGFPVDITRAVLAERGGRLDEAAFEAAMKAQRTRARAASNLSGNVFEGGPTLSLKERKVPATVFLGYAQDSASGAVAGILRGNAPVQKLAAGEEALLVVDRTAFYAEGGGQVGDRGALRGKDCVGAITNCKKIDGYHLHALKLERGQVAVGDTVELLVDVPARRATERNHTATHLLHQALKDVLGAHVGQAGSLVAPERLRFDFTHGERLSGQQIEQLETLVNRHIMAAQPVQAVERSMEEARRSGFLAMFGEKYGEVVRTLAVGDYSKELCGGTHVRNSGNIGLFRIVGEGSVASGIRRIEAVTGELALTLAREDRTTLERIAGRLKVPAAEVGPRVETLLEELKQLKRDKDKAPAAAAGGAAEKILASGVTTGDTRVFVACEDGLDGKALQALSEKIAKDHKSYACCLISRAGDRIAILAAASTDRVQAGFHAGNLIRELSQLLEGGGGGRADFAQGQGKRVDRLAEALALARSRLV